MVQVVLSYCKSLENMKGEDRVLNKHYHDNEYGFPIEDDNLLFGRYILEMNQAGLSWTTILRKKDNFYKAYDQYDIAKIAAYKQEDIDRLLSNSGIIRNKLKIHAAIYNAKRIQEIQEEHGSFKAWLDKFHPLKLEEWVKLFKKTFKFTGREIVNEFLMSTGYLPGAHDKDCPVYHEIYKYSPAWLR